MTFYVLLFSLCYLIGTYCYFSNKKPSLFGVSLFLVVIAYFVACRLDVGKDWGSYVSFYNTGFLYGTESDDVIEPLFLLSREILYPLGITYEGFFFIFSFFSMFAVCKVSNRFNIHNYYYVFLVYISLAFCQYQLNLVRTGIAASCIWLSFSYKKENYLKSFLWFLIAVGFHYMSLIIFPFYFFIDRAISKKWYFYIIIFSIIVSLLGLVTRMIDSVPFLSAIDRISNYFDPDSRFRNESRFSLGTIFGIIFIVFLRNHLNKEYINNVFFRIMMNAYLLTIFIVLIFSNINIIVSRVGMALNISLCFIWPIFLSTIKRNQKLLWLLPYTAFQLLYFLQGFKYDALDGGSSLLPYSFKFSFLFFD